MNNDLKQLFLELEGVEEEGITLKLDGYPSSPMQIVEACKIREDNCYMRDYISDDEGKIRELNFDKVEQN